MKIFTYLFLLSFVCIIPVRSNDNDFSEFDDEFMDKSDDVTVGNVEKNIEVADSSSASNNPSLELPDDEFEGLNEAPEAKKKSPADKNPDLKIVKVSPHMMYSWNNYQLELFIMLALVIYMLNFTVGKAKNFKLAQAWFAAHQEILNENFAIVGDDGVSNPPTNALNKEYEHVYSLWCTGRASVEAVLIEIRLINRQCLISSLFNIFRPVNDNIVIKIILDDNELDGIVFAVGKKKRIQTLAKDHIDLSTFCKEKKGHPFPSLHESFVYLSETSDGPTGILTSKVCSVMNEYKNNFEYIYVSDQYCGPKPSNATAEEHSMVHITQTQKVIIFCFKPGSKGEVNEEDMESMLPMMEFVFHTIEKITRLKLSKLCKQKSDRNRKSIIEARMKLSHSLRQEAAQSRKDEKKRAVKERIMAEEDPEKAKRMAEREEKKERRKQPKIKMIKSK